MSIAMYSRRQPSWLDERQKGSWKVWDDGLARPPKAIPLGTQKAKVHQKWRGQPVSTKRFIRLVGEWKRNGHSCGEFSIAALTASLNGRCFDRHPTRFDDHDLKTRSRRDKPKRVKDIRTNWVYSGLAKPAYGSS